MSLSVYMDVHIPLAITDAGTPFPLVGGSIALVSTQCSTNPIG